MRPFGLLALAAVMAALGACASAQESAQQDAQLSAQVFTDAPAAPAPPARASLSPFDAMRVALPTFELRQDAAAAAGEVSVARDVTFPAESSILPRPQVDRLVPLQAYLRANPDTAVRIEGHGDGAPGASGREQDASLSQDRAQAVARALLTDMRIAPKRITTVTAAPMAAIRPQRAGWAEIILVAP